MRINNNLMSMNTHRVMTDNARKTVKHTEKLSSGYRINRAGDDAAGLAISEKMRSQIRGLEKAARNAQDGVSLIQTAEGGAANVHKMLQRVRELAVQSANDTLVDDDRAKIQDEVLQIIEQVDGIANNTEFNTRKILNSDGTALDASVTADLTAKIPTMLDDALQILTGSYGIALPDPANTNIKVEYYSDPGSGAGASMGTSDGISLTLRFNLANITDGSGNLIPDDQLDRLVAHEMMHGLQFTEMNTFLAGGLSTDETWVAEGLAMLIQGGNDFTAALTNNSDATIGDAWGGTTADYAEAYLAMRTLHEITDGGIAAFIDRLEAGDTLDQAMNATTQDGSAELNPGADFTTYAQFESFFDSSAAVDTYLDTEDEFANTGTGAVNTNASTQGSDDNPSIAATIPNGGVTTTLDSKYTLDFSGATSGISAPLTFLIGANEGQNISFSTKNLQASVLGIANIDLGNRDSASLAIETIDSAIETVSAARSYFGATQNRLEYAISSLYNTAENLQASESRIRDVDIAKEMMSLTKSNILQQASQSMLAQANQKPQEILQLLR